MVKYVSKPKTAVGQIALHNQLCSNLPEPPVQSYVYSGSRRTVVGPTSTEEFYPSQYATDGTLIGNLRFAFKYEPFDLRIILSALTALGTKAIQKWVKSEPTSGYARRAWFLYEKFVEILKLPDAASGNYVDALDTERHYVADPVNSRRHRVRDNLLGNSRLCPIIRRTAKLNEMMGWGLEAETNQIAQRYTTDTIARAVSFLYTKETRSSYAIEGETPSANREERFLSALKQAAKFFPVEKSGLIKLQANIVDPRYAAKDWRDFQNFVSETTRNFGEQVHFICPKPEDVPDLMRGWLEMGERLRQASLDPIIVAAVISFSFVFIHPFEDGNGRIHRFLIHALLASRNFGPHGIIIPVSAAILRQRTEYDRILELFSRPIMSAIEWDFQEDRAICVKNETRNLYRFFDATAQVEFLYERVAEAIRTDLIEEANFLETFDHALRAVRAVVDMPDKRASLFAQICLNNRGRLSKKKRREFDELTDAEIQRIEQEIVGFLKRSEPLAAIGWSEKRILERLQAYDGLEEQVEQAVASLHTDWDDPYETDELDNIDGHSFNGSYDLYDLSIESVEKNEEIVVVEVTGELAFAVDFEVSVSDPDRRIYDPEDKGRILLEAPVFQREVPDQDFQRTVLFTLTLGSGDSFQVESLEFEDDGALTVLRPDVSEFYEEEDEDPREPDYR